jgi:hypothetical protein
MAGGRFYGGVTSHPTAEWIANQLTEAVAGNKLRGGNATGAGVTFQASAAQLLAERPLDGRLGLGGAKARSIRFESEAPLDDILLVRRRSCRCANRYCVSR